MGKDQIEEYGPPPNPTKLTDSRANGYIDEFGYECWELDALKPEVIEQLITVNVERYLDRDLFNEVVEREEEARRTLQNVASHWEQIEEEYKDEE